MKMPPLFMRFRVHGENRFGIGCWIPLFILWPILAVIVVPLLPLIILAEAILRLSGHACRPFGILLALYDFIASLRGLHVDVQDKTRESTVFVSIT